MEHAGAADTDAGPGAVDRLMTFDHIARLRQQVDFFLEGIIQISEESAHSAQRIDALRERCAREVNSLDAQVALNARKFIA